MTSRERWTVYPLLLFALGLGLKDKIAPGKVYCSELVVVSPDWRPLVRAGMHPGNGSGSIVAYGYEGVERFALVSDIGQRAPWLLSISQDPATGKYELRRFTSGPVASYSPEGLREQLDKWQVGRGLPTLSKAIFDAMKGEPPAVQPETKGNPDAVGADATADEASAGDSTTP